ncbi:hypothetical protein OG379_40825 (plasmid) [Streptomyces sp. NBC_01166]|uniref:hypothetical protein n=1 Tax=Streptomyces sp. NBC_01166 TaxID=2903755 RepID=UPI002F90CCB0|nr:hypothetical protein OG379_40825 [Streptomyces sp. NBC_01166]
MRRPGDSLGTTNLSLLQRAAKSPYTRASTPAAQSWAPPDDLTAASVNGRRAGRPGTHTPERTA